MGKSALATFRVDEGKWKRFQELAKESGYSASALLVGFIDRSLDSGIEAPPEPKPSVIDENLDGRIESYLDWYLDKRIEGYLEGIIDTTLDSRIESYLDTNLDRRIKGELDSNLDRRIERIIDRRIETVLQTVSELEGYTKGQLEAVRTEIQKLSENRTTSNSQDEITKAHLGIATLIPQATPRSPGDDPSVPSSSTPTEAVSTMTWGKFHDLVGLKAPGFKDKNKKNAEIALAKATEMGITGWWFDSSAKVFKLGE